MVGCVIKTYTVLICNCVVYVAQKNKLSFMICEWCSIINSIVTTKDIVSIYLIRICYQNCHISNN